MPRTLRALTITVSPYHTPNVTNASPPKTMPRNTRPVPQPTWNFRNHPLAPDTRPLMLTYYAHESLDTYDIALTETHTEVTTLAYKKVANRVKPVATTLPKEFCIV
ncbi:hypothetical protein Hypma_006026 [Hypsizygus marmoreus]|uniref:Uncharacterized protein n=1 Tax=Hypsizygus marmoreus TaxID=39966 RepID=A0A369K1G4_HYPMA|nr:hypothetical protein Hypma_006026 [Hypsizygus marmoreus]